jgi:hypothetical protein
MSKAIRVVAAVNGIAVLALGAARLNQPAGSWDARGTWLIVALLVTGLVPFVQAVIAERGEKARRKALELESALQSYLVTSLIYIVRHCGADWHKTGVQVFRVRRRLKVRRSRPFRILRPLRLWTEEHDRTTKVRLAAIPSSGIEWTEGKGVIGRCWATRQPEFVDLSRHFGPYDGYDETQWNSLSEEDRYGFTYQDFLRTKGKYGFVAAVPIIDRKEKYVGCVSLDTPPGNPADLPRDATLESLATTASLVRELLARQE